LRNKAAALEARIAELERDQPEALFRGKPATYWVKALRDRDPKFRQEALTALGGIAEVDRSIVPTIVGSLLRDTDDEVRDAASQVLAGRVGDAALPLLIAALKDTNQEYRVWAMYTIGRFGDYARPAVDPLVALLKSKQKTDRIVAAETLGRIGPDAAAAVPPLVERLKDRATVECYVAATALGRMGPSAKPAVPLLIDMLKDTGARKFPFDRSLLPLFQNGFDVMPATTAAIALGQIGPAASAALPALQEMARDVRIQGYAHNAIRNIEPAAEKR